MECPLPGSNIYVDWFSPRRGTFILTHMHSDHLRGLSGSRWRTGFIHTSHINARLLIRRALCAPGVIRAHNLEEPFTIEDGGAGYTGVFVDSGHCPGSVMVVVQGMPGGPIVHTGDLRVHDELFQSPILKEIRGERVQRLCLDMSCSNVESLPLKAVSVNHLLDVFDRHEGRRFFLHSRGLGDEELLTAVSDHFSYNGTKLMFADRRRFDELQITDPSLHSRCALLPDCRLHVIANCRLIVIANSAQRRSDPRLVDLEGVEINPSTLWFCNRYANVAEINPSMQDQRTGIWHILWSMHSSAEELRAFVDFLAPATVHPICRNIGDQCTRGIVVNDEGFRISSSSPASGVVGFQIGDAPAPAGSPPAASSAMAVAGATSASSTWTWATRPAPAPDTMALLHNSQWDELADHVGIPALARSLKRRRTATTELDSDSSCSNTLPEDFDETPILQ